MVFESGSLRSISRSAGNSWHAHVGEGHVGIVVSARTKGLRSLDRIFRRGGVLRSAYEVEGL